MRALCRILVVSAFATGLAPGVRAGTAEALAPHRAIYELELTETADRSAVRAMRGRLVYELSGSHCSGFTTAIRFVTRLETGASTRLHDQRTTTYENLADGTFHFLNKVYIDRTLDQEVRGSAEARAGATAVELTKPESGRFSLDAAYFPSGHMIAVIDRAKAGERFYRSNLFDGSDNGHKVYRTTAVIGASMKPGGDGREREDAGALADLYAWPVTITYFNDTENPDGTPVYQIYLKLYENGVSRNFEIDYGAFAFKGTLTSLEAFEREAC